MTLFTVDSNNVFGKSVAEAGCYNVKILSDSKCTKTKNTQEDMAVLNYEVVDGEYMGGKILYDNIVWKSDDIELSTKRFNTVLVAMDVANGTPIESIQKLVEAAKGKLLNITVDWKFSDYAGKWNLHVKSYRKTDPDGSKPNGVKRPDDQKQGQSTTAHQQSLPGVDPFNGITDDDLPF